MSAAHRPLFCPPRLTNAALSPIIMDSRRLKMEKMSSGEAVEIWENGISVYLRENGVDIKGSVSKWS